MANRQFSLSNTLANTHNNRASVMAQNFGSQQVSTTSLLNQLHSAFVAGQHLSLGPSTSLVVNTWASDSVIDQELGARAWEHARRRAEDGCIVLGSLHHSTPSIFHPFCEALPFTAPRAFYASLAVLRPFLHRVTQNNPSTPSFSAFSAAFGLSLEGELQSVSLSLSTGGIDTRAGLLSVPSESGCRAFDVFYYLLASASVKERDFLGLKSPSQYTLLKKSGTYNPPTYLPSTDDAASAENWRESLREIGIKGADFRNMLCVLAALLRLGDAVGYLVDQEELEATCEEVGQLLELDAEVLLKRCVTDEREMFISGLYEALVDWVIAKANEAIRDEMSSRQAMRSSSGSDIGAIALHGHQDDGINATLSVVEIPGVTLGQAVGMKTVFDDKTGINAEIKDDGIAFVPAGSSLLREMKEAIGRCEPDLNLTDSASGREWEMELDRRQAALEKIGADAEPDTFLHRVLYSGGVEGTLPGKHGRFNLLNLIETRRVWLHLCLHPIDDPPSTLVNQSSPWSAGSVSSQIRSWRLAEWANHRNKQLDFTADFDFDEFVDRYSRLGCQAGREGIEAFILERGWSNGDVVLGSERVWMRESAWWQEETILDTEIAGRPPTSAALTDDGLDNPRLHGPVRGISYIHTDSGNASRESLLPRQHDPFASSAVGLGPASFTQTARQTLRSDGGDYGLGVRGDDKYDGIIYEGEVDPELIEGKEIEVHRVTFGRRAWVALVWLVTFWIPSPLLHYVGRMKRPDVRLAWREKLTLILLIFLLNGAIVFYIVEFGRLLCPNFDKAWNAKEVSYHQGVDDYWVSFRGGVYDFSTFWKVQHSDSIIQVTQTNMQPFAGTDVSGYVVPPLYLACPDFVTDKFLQLQSNTTLPYSIALHTTGHYDVLHSQALSHNTWYFDRFLPKMQTMYKGELVVAPDTVKSMGDAGRLWVIIESKIYDLSDYFYTSQARQQQTAFLGDQIGNLIQSHPGLDITKEWNTRLGFNEREAAMKCLNNRFYVGNTDYRLTPRCQVQNYLLLAFTIILCAVILTKFLAALQLGTKRRPAQQDKFVICQVPAYTEGEDSLRKGLDSLTALAYDNKRKLICVICDGMVVGGGNDRPTAKIVLDILGVDPKIDPPALPFKSVGQGSEQLNYGKVYSGLYEYEGNVVPYVVVVKIGKESERASAKPGNRGKRDSQILLMSFLNRVHHRAPMNPLELEMFHQINNIIGVNPENYEYLFMVDADTKVKEDSLNRLVAACANDAKIAGICGETSLENEERSWWTMIQVYEYYISHHLAKSFESLFASVTCLPGCFCMYRLRTADKGRPLIISSKVIRDYADSEVDTLHKKNLLSLGEDRYLTTLMTKHFPAMSYKFLPGAYALTEAPSEWGILLSQRRRWINSTVHNLVELFWLKDLCGFCCFSMRFVVLIDLVGTIILPATFGYLVYLVYRVAAHAGSFPLISLVVLAAVYGLQAIIFILKRQWQHVGWMIIYLLAYPIYSLVLPVYSFWKMDDFSWGSTRIVIGEKGNKKVVAVDDEGFNPRCIPLQRWDDYALANGLPGGRGDLAKEKNGYDEGGMGYEMDEMYSATRPASSILTGFPMQQQFMSQPLQQQRQASSATLNQFNRQSSFSQYTDNPLAPNQSSQRFTYNNMLANAHDSRHQSRDSLRNMHSPPPQQGIVLPSSAQPQPHHSKHSSLSGVANDPLASWSRRSSTANVMASFTTQGPPNEAIAAAIRECLAEVDLDNVTKKQLKALTEQKLKCQLTGEKRSFMDSQIDLELANM